MKYVGVFDLLGHVYEFYTENNEIFYHDESGEKVADIEQLKDWALIINSPWSQANEQYVLKVNCKDGYSEIPDGTPLWKCAYSIVGYDGMMAVVMGYGNNPKEALLDCQSFFEFLQKTYNPNDESV